MRVFVALPPSPGFLDAAEEALSPLMRVHRNFRWTPRENIHVTLAFLGEIDSRGVSLLDAVVRETAANVRPIQVTSEKLILLPSPGRANILALNVAQGKARIASLADFLEQNLARAAAEEHYPFRPREKRAFTPHLTAARKSGGMRLAPEDFFPFRLEGVMDRVVVFKSDLLKTGPVYTPLGEYGLQTTDLAQQNDL
jgi:2'-5' RNA ligase